MWRNSRFFIISNGSLDLKEVRFLKTKLTVTGVLVACLVVGALLFANHLSGDLFGLGYDRMAALTAENQILKDQIRELSGKMASVQAALDRLSDEGNELRLVADLHRIDDDTRFASVGGGIPSAANAFLNGEAAEILSGAQAMIDRLSREVRLQQTSYEEISRKMEYNKIFFAHLPAIKPMAGGYSVNGFGMRLHPVLRVYRMHTGVDIIADVGANIFAAGDGAVRFAGRTQGGYGIVVEIDHGYGYSSLYAHLSQVAVRPGQSVKRGQLIAKSGRTGLVSGPHLHYEIRRGGTRLNPVDYFFDDVDAARYRTLLASATR
jgi:murein DD-endopeptidase MepM/ murein hydrolase activator NlpD